MHVRKLPFAEEDEANGQVRQWTICAICDEDGRCQVEDFLAEQIEGPLADVAAQFLAFLDSIVYDEEGPRRWIGTPRCHESVADQRIYEFRQNRLRVHWFYGAGRSVAILAIGALKQQDQTPRQLAKKLIKLKQDYANAVADGTLVEIEAGQGN